MGELSLNKKVIAWSKKGSIWYWAERRLDKKNKRKVIFMKKAVLLFAVLIFFLITLTFISFAADNTQFSEEQTSIKRKCAEEINANNSNEEGDKTVVITLICGVVMAVTSCVTVYFSKKQMCVSKKHNILSVKPSIDFFLTITGTDGIKIGIHNSGIGPANILGLNYQNKITGEKGISISDQVIEEIKKEYPERSIDLLICDYTGYNKNLNNHCLGVNASIELFSFEFCPNVENETKRNIRKMISNYSMAILYTDFYESKTWYTKKDLDFFDMDINKKAEEQNTINIDVFEKIESIEQECKK